MPRRERPLRLLFVGRRNDSRTQMAEGFARHRLDPREFVAGSAGLAPTDVRPWAVRVMAEVDIDISAQRSRSLETILASAVDKVILVEDGLLVPARFLEIRRLQWHVDDPDSASPSSDEMMRSFRAARDRLEPLVLGLNSLVRVARRSGGA
jgi:arsenate reductase